MEWGYATSHFNAIGLEGNGAGAELLSIYPVWVFTPFLKMPRGPLFTDEAASHVIDSWGIFEALSSNSHAYGDA